MMMTRRRKMMLSLVVETGSIAMVGRGMVRRVGRPSCYLKETVCVVRDANGFVDLIVGEATVNPS
jgi:hypothetical protein